MSSLSLKLGLWSALLCALAFVVFTICFVAIAATQPLFVWTNLADYVTSVQENNQLFKHVAQLAMLLFGPLFVLLLNSIHALAREEQAGFPEGSATLTRAALLFGAIFAALSGSHYFIQLSTVRHNITAGELQGLEQLVQANPGSPLLAANMLGFTLFLGLASLCVTPVFGGRRLPFGRRQNDSRLQKVIRASFVANGIFCLLGGVGFVLQITWLVFVTINLGMGGALLAATVGLALFFRRVARDGVVLATT